MTERIKSFRQNQKEIEFRLLEPAEREAYTALHRICFPRMANNADHANWWIFNSEFPNRNYALACQGRVIAAYSYLPIRLKFGDAIRPAAMVSNVMVHPEFRGQGLFLEFNRLCLQHEKEFYRTSIFVGRTDLLVGYLKVGWATPTRLVYYAKPPSPGAELGKNLKALEKFDARLDPLLDGFYRRIHFGLIKNTDFLNFRIFRKPGVHYGVYASVDGNQQVNGYIVFKKFHDVERGISKGHIVDVVALDYATFSSLIDCAEHHNKDCAEINILQPERSIFETFLLRKGWQRGSKYNPDEHLIVFDAERPAADFPAEARHYVIADDESW